jgi:hypothetical protein
MVGANIAETVGKNSVETVCEIIVEMLFVK